MRVDHQFVRRAEVEIVALPVHHHGVGHIRQAHGRAGGTGEQLRWRKNTATGRGAEPDEVAGGAGDGDIDGIGGSDKPVPFKPISLIGAGLQVGGSHTA